MSGDDSKGYMQALTPRTARQYFDDAARTTPPMPSLKGTGVVICAGGPFVPSSYVVVRLLREFGFDLPVEIWHAGPDEFPEWARAAFKSCDVSFHDVATFYPERPLKELRGWPIKPAALINSKFRHTLFLDADCFPLRNLMFLFQSDEYKRTGALFWPDNKHYKMVEGGPIWNLTGIRYNADSEFETGIFAIDKERCWRELCLAQWMNANSDFWYDYVMGDKDTFYLAMRKTGRDYFIGPPCKRYQAIITRHFWKDGTPLVDHRTGTSKYSLPTRKGPFRVHLSPYKHRPTNKNLYDEIMQRFIVRNFTRHAGYLQELNRYLTNVVSRRDSR